MHSEPQIGASLVDHRRGPILSSLRPTQDVPIVGGVSEPPYMWHASLADCARVWVAIQGVSTDHEATPYFMSWSHFGSSVYEVRARADVQTSTNSCRSSDRRDDPHRCCWLPPKRSRPAGYIVDTSHELERNRNTLRAGRHKTC